MPIDYCCPRCHGALDQWTERYQCTTCAATYPIIAGIADFRVYADPYISIEDDRAKGAHLHQAAATRTFAELVAYYYAITPEVTPEQARRFLAHHVAGDTRGRGMLDRLARYQLLDSAPHHWLDVGCGTAGFLAAASAQASNMDLAGIDIAFRWLVVARKRLAEQGHDHVRLACACADYMPFPDHSFDLIVAENVLEHTPDAMAVLAECKRVRQEGSGVMARTVNRYAPTREPHVGVWGVGYLPRRLMDRYVRWRVGLPYQHVMLQSAGSLRRLARNSGNTDLVVRHPLYSPYDFQHHGQRQQKVFHLYSALATTIPPLRPLLTMIGPFLDLVSTPRR